MSNLILSKGTEICAQNKMVNSTAQYLYLKLAQYAGKQRHNMPEQPAHNLSITKTSKKSDSAIKMAFICDEMTWLDFCDECNSLFLYPGCWKEQMEQFQPQFLFCEATWSGLAPWPNSWRGQVYRNNLVYFENRTILNRILSYCHENKVITIFWNKEDPTFFNHKRYDFVDTALTFDYLFTTAVECVTRYQLLGHKKVYPLPFGVNSRLFCPENKKKYTDRVVFAGSWFGDLEQRCKDMCQMFDFVLSQGFELDIYNRKAASREQRFQFPAQYSAYLRPFVPYREMASVLNHYTYAINVNSATESATMYSRRLLQLLACGLTVWSNRAVGFDQIPGVRVIERLQDGDILLLNGDPIEIYDQHSSSHRFTEMMNIVTRKTSEEQESSCLPL